MAAKIDDITVRYEDTEGKEIIRELDKEILSRGAWTTIMFLYEELDPKTGEFKGPKVTIRRYKKIRGEFRQQSKFNISSGKQAMTIANTLTKWFSEACPSCDKTDNDT